MSLFGKTFQVFFAPPDAGTLVNATDTYVNAYTGDKTAFSAPNDLSSTMKTYYDTELLENARPNLIHAQFARKQPLPKGRGKSVEWRKWNTLADAPALQEGVIPTGQKFGQSSMTSAIVQHGTYVTVSDQLELHAIDTLAAGKNVQYCDKVSAAGEHTKVESRAAMDKTSRLTPTEVNKAVTTLKKQKAPKIDGKYVAIIHPSVTFDIRENKDWIEAHKYADVRPLFDGEIGELHGVRFVETTEAKVWCDSTCPTKTGGNLCVYSTLFLGKDAFGMIDPEGGGLEMIIKSKEQAGGPLNQFSTIGYKFSTATKILYPERMVRVESTSEYSETDEKN